MRGNDICTLCSSTEEERGESRGSGPCSRVVDVLTSDHEHVDCILRVKL